MDGYFLYSPHTGEIAVFTEECMYKKMYKYTNSRLHKSYWQEWGVYKAQECAQIQYSDIFLLPTYYYVRHFKLDCLFLIVKMHSRNSLFYLQYAYTEEYEQQRGKGSFPAHLTPGYQISKKAGEQASDVSSEYKTARTCLRVPLQTHRSLTICMPLTDKVSSDVRTGD